jgi:pilus assembly protein CpaF
MLQAMNTGHEGSLSTCHANGPADALRRLETMVLLGEVVPLDAVREQVAASLDLVVHVARDAFDGARRVVAVAEVVRHPRRGDDRVRVLTDDAGRLRDLPHRGRRQRSAPEPSEQWLA